MNALTVRAQASSRFMYTFAKVIKTRMKVTANEWRFTAKAEGYSSVKIGNS